MSVHYKFKSALEYDTVTFDGLHISVKDLKKAIIHQKRIGKNTDFDLQVTNAQTKEVYNDENALIPKNTSLVIARIPMVAQAKAKPWEGYGTPTGAPGGAAVRPEEGALSKAVDLTQLDASEDDKIRAMMTQSTLDYDPSNYMKIRGSNQVGVVPTHYRCFKCHQPGHWIKDCPLGHGQEPMEIKKSTGIPRSFMVPVEGPMVPGAMMTPTGQYAVPVLDHQAYNEVPKTAVPTEEKPEIPEDLLCTICKDLLTDAVMIPCCGNSFCDECIRTVLLESEDHECPDCHEKEISPGTLIPNRFLRNSVSVFKNETGYHKRQQYRNAVVPQNQISQEVTQNVDTKPVAQEPVVHPAESTTETRAASPPVKQEQVKPDSQTADEPERTIDSQKPIISEADSTETTKSNTPVKEEQQEKASRMSPLVEGPPGVESPILEKPPGAEEIPPGVDTAPSKPPPRVKQGQAITSVGSAVNHHRVHYHSSRDNSHSRSSRDENSRHYRDRDSIPSYSEQNSRNVEERPGTPTVDEPGMGPPGYSGSDPVPYSDAAPPGLHPTATTLPPSQHMHPPPQIQGPPPPQAMAPPPYAIPPAATHYPPPTAPPPAGFRLPPPGHPDYNRAFPPRPIFDPTRPPVPFDPHRPPIHGAPPPGYPAYPPGPRPAGRPYPPPRHMQPPPPGMNHRPPPHQPPNVIDDPLEAFNRMLREKDERDRRARQRRVTRSRSYSRSRSSSRSFSRSPRSRSRTPPPRTRHRSRTRSPPPRRRSPRSRSRSFSISRSRSFSRSPSFRGSPGRDYSPRRRPSSRYRSPVSRASPPRYRYKDSRPLISDRDRDRLLDRHSDRHDRHERPHDRSHPEREPRDAHYFDAAPPAAADHFDYEGYDRGSSGSSRAPRPPLLRNPRYGGPPRKDYAGQEGYYPPEPYANRYNRGGGPNYPPPLMSVKTIPPHPVTDRPEGAPHRKYDDVAPPGIEQPPVPGFENQRYDSRYPFDRQRDDGPPGVDRYQKSPYSEREGERPPRPETTSREFRDRPRETRDTPGEARFDRKYSPSPERKHKSSSPKRSSRDRVTSPEKSRRRRRDESSDRDKRNDSKNESDREKKEKKRETSEDEKSRKSKDKKKKKEKREAERKKKKERKEKKEQEKLKKAEEKKAKETTTKDSKDPKDEDKKTDLPPPDKKETKQEPAKIEENPQPVKKEHSPPPKPKEPEPKPKIVDHLYDDILSEGIDSTVVENYGKIDQHKKEGTPSPILHEKKPQDEPMKTNDEESEEKDTSFDGIELQANEAELKSDFIDTKTKASEMLAPLPEPSKWEIEEDGPNTPEKAHPSESKSELKQVFERPGKVVTSEVIKRAENAIFAKAINAIRPIEIKKISLDRAKLYSGEKNSSHSPSESSTIKEPVKNFQITIPGWNLDDIPPPGTEPIKLKQPKSSPPPNRLSVKERLGCKVEELDRLTKEEKPFERNRSRTLSPLSRRIEEGGRNVSLGERRVEVDDRRREEYRRPEDRYKHERRYESRTEDRDRRVHSRSERSRSRDGKYRERRQERQSERKDARREDRREERRDDRRSDRSRSRHRSDRTDRRHDYNREERHKEPDKRETKERERKPSRSRKSKSRSESRDRKDKRKKSKDKKHKKEKEKEKDKDRKRHKKEDDQEDYKSSEVKVESKIISDKKGDDSKSEKTEKAKPVDDRRKPTLDEASFEPDYDLETESEKEEVGKKSESRKRDRSKSPEKKPEVKKRKIEEPEKKKEVKESSSSDSSDSSSDEKHKKKHKKHKKKKSRRDTSSSSDSSDSDSSVDKKKKRHKSSKKIKKKKKSKHK